MIRRGISENVAMKISGHKTVSVFRRYDIVSKEDLRRAAQLIEGGRSSDSQCTDTVHPDE